MRARKLILGAVLILGLGLVACQQQTPTPTPTATSTTPAAIPTLAPTATATSVPATPTATPRPPTPTATPTATPSAPVIESADLLMMLNEQSASGQAGWAALTAEGDQTVVVLNLTAGTMETEMVHIHTGSCGDTTLGGVAKGLSKFVDGSGYSVTTVDLPLDSLRNGDFAINSHQTGNLGTYTTCGDIPIEADSITISLEEQSASGQSDWASLTARGSKTEVVLLLSPGTMQTEMVHIHTGQCGDTLGGVAKGLTKFAGGSGGSMTLVDLSLSSLRNGDFAINSHQTGNLGTYTSCGNIPAGAGGSGGTGGTTASTSDGSSSDEGSGY